MAKFRKKPVVIEAVQVVKSEPIPDGVCFCDEGGGPKVDEGTPSRFQAWKAHVHTIEGPLHVSEGDWLIIGVKGERYPVKNDIFRLTYEEIQDSAR